MMKVVVCIILIAIQFFSNVSYSQQTTEFTLSKTNHTVHDGEYYNHYLHEDTLVTLPTGQYRKWELNNYIKHGFGGSLIENSYLKSTNLNYKDAIVQNSKIGIGRGKLIDVKSYFHQNEQGFFEFVNRIDTSISILVKKGNYVDSIYFPPQTIALSAPSYYLQYPAKYGSAWKSVYTKTIYATLTIKSLNLLNVPMQYIEYINISDSVVGDGIMSVPRIGLVNKSKLYNVLLVHRTYVRQDSVFINNQPAPQSVLDFLDFEYSTPEPFYTVLAWRAESGNYLARIRYWQDSTFTKSREIYIAKDEIDPAVVSSVIEKSPVSLTTNPNPSCDLVTINVNNSSSTNLTVELYNQIGQKVDSYFVTDAESSITIDVRQLPSGQYHVIIFNQDRKIQTSKSLLVEH